MWRSVPQMEVAFTRTRTSVGPTAGTGTFSICRPFPGCVFRNAFIIVATACARLRNGWSHPACSVCAQLSMLAYARKEFRVGGSPRCGDRGNGGGNRRIEKRGATADDHAVEASNRRDSRSGTDVGGLFLADASCSRARDF